MKVEHPEVYPRVDWDKFIKKLIGFEEWIDKNSEPLKQRSALIKLNQKYGRKTN